MDKSPILKIIDIPEMTNKEKELFSKTIMPGIQKELDIAFMQYKRNSIELGSAITHIMNHGESLEKSKYGFYYYENENHVGFYWYNTNMD